MLRKLKAPFIISIILLILILLFSIVYSIFFQSSENENRNIPKEQNPPRDLTPTTQFEDPTQNIKIDYSPGTDAYWVYIEAETAQEYIERRKVAADQLRKMGVDLCDYSKTYWTSPPSLKGQFTEEDFNTVTNFTCPL